MWRTVWWLLLWWKLCWDQGLLLRLCWCLSRYINIINFYINNKHLIHHIVGQNHRHHKQTLIKTVQMSDYRRTNHQRRMCLPLRVQGQDVHLLHHLQDQDQGQALVQHQGGLQERILTRYHLYLNKLILILFIQVNGDIAAAHVHSHLHLIQAQRFQVTSTIHLQKLYKEPRLHHPMLLLVLLQLLLMTARTMIFLVWQRKWFLIQVAKEMVSPLMMTQTMIFQV